MNNLRKTMVLFAIGVMTISLVLVPFAPMAKVDSQVAQAPVDYKELFEQKWANRLMDGLSEGKMDPILSSYIETGALDESIVTTAKGAIKLLLTLAPNADTSSIASIGTVRWQLDLDIVRLASVDVTSAMALKMLEDMDDVLYIMPDVYLEPTPIEAADDVQSSDMFHIRDLVGATGTYASDYDGSGVIVGVDDTGVDFSQPDLKGAEYNNGTHPMSYDPSSYGLTAMVIGNCSYVANVTAWLEAGYVLTYEMDGKYYLDVNGWDPTINNGGGGLPLLWWMDYLGGLYSIHNFTEFIMNVMWQDWEIPAPTADNYTFGWVQERRSCTYTGGYSRLFAPAMIYDGDVIIDWNGTLAWTTMFMDAYYYESIDLNVTADRDYISNMMDWSFVDDIAEGYVFNGANNVLAADLDDDMEDDIGLGSLSWAYDDLGYLEDLEYSYYGVFSCITDDWLAFNILFTGGTAAESNHGHWTSSAIVSRGVYDHEVYANGTTYKLPGVAPGASLIFTKGITSGGGIMADFWAAGFHLNETSGYWEYFGDGLSHKAHMVSNSWGWGPGGSYLQLVYYGLVYDIASVPGVLAPSYPGTLFLFSAGNEGADYGTAGTPGASFSVISVGASIASHYYVNSGATQTYSPWQENNQEIYFSSHGPGFTGIVKPDVMAPGYRGVNPQPFPQVWLDTGASYYWWQGTSLSCPIAAGVAALIMEAYFVAHAAWPTPQQVKDILLSTATDLGTDPFSQGHGMVNAEAAIEAIETGAADEYYFESNSFANYGDQIAETWNYWMPGWDPMGIYYEQETPVGLETSSIFFGTVNRAGTYAVNLDVTGFDGVGYDTAAFDTIMPWYYAMQRQIKFSETSYRYDDPNFSPVVNRPGWFVLTDHMTAEEETDFWAANYVTIHVTHGAALTGAYPMVRLFDWNDSNADTFLNFWNITTATGDYLAHVSRYTDACNLMTMRIGSANTIAGVFDYDPTLQFDAAAGVAFDVTITVWQKVEDTDVSFADSVTGGIDFTLNVDALAEYGAHQGSIMFMDASSGFIHQVPYSYMVDFEIAGAQGAVNTLVDTFGDELTPYETGAVTTSFIYGTTSTQEAGGLKTFHIEIPYNIAINASVLVMRAEWTNPGTVVDFALRAETYELLTGTNLAGTFFNPVVTGELSNVIIFDAADLINGTYWFYYMVRVFDGVDVPENITITMQVYNATALATASFGNTWTSRTMTTPTTFSDGQNLVGDHVVITNTWNLPATAGLPEYSIASTKIALLSGLYAVMTGTYADPQGNDAWPIPLTSTNAYKWETVEGISAGDIVRVSLSAPNSADPSFDVWAWDDANSDGEVSLDELGSASLLSVDNGGGGAAESGQYTAPEAGDIAIRVFCWAWAFNGQSYTLTVDTRASRDILSEAGTPEYTEFDTYLLLRNITMTVIFTCYTATDVVFEVELGSVRFCNYFRPHLIVNVPSETSANHFTFTWSSTDQNDDDVAYYSIWLSRDGGVSYVLLQQNLTSTSFAWDSTEWIEDNYTLRVRAYSCDFSLGLCDVSNPPIGYWPADFTDGFTAEFAAGGVPVTPTTTTATTTTTPTSGVVTPIDPLLIGLVAGIGVGVVVVLILFLIKKK